MVSKECWSCVSNKTLNYNVGLRFIEYVEKAINCHVTMGIKISYCPMVYSCDQQ